MPPHNIQVVKFTGVRAKPHKPEWSLWTRWQGANTNTNTISDTKHVTNKHNNKVDENNEAFKQTNKLKKKYYP